MNYDLSYKKKKKKREEKRDPMKTLALVGKNQVSFSSQ